MSHIAMLIAFILCFVISWYLGVFVSVNAGTYFLIGSAVAAVAIGEVYFR